MNEEVETDDALEEVYDYLEHFGIKGMRWGVRRSVGSNGRVGQRKRRDSTDFKTTAPLRKRPARTLTNMQLKKVNERMQLEQKFHKMNPTKVQRGKDYVDDVLRIGTGAAGLAGIIKLAQRDDVQDYIRNGRSVLQSKGLVRIVREATRRGKHFA